MDATVYWQTWMPYYHPVKVVEEEGVHKIRDAIKRNEPIIFGGYSERGAHHGFKTKDCPMPKDQQS